MPKMKTRKGLAKRVRVTRNGKVVRNRAGKRHLLSGKSGKRKRALRKKAVVDSADNRRVLRALRGH
jgi:large subunit ribosomal protein L35